MRKQGKRTYVIPCPMDVLPEGEYNRICCSQGQSGLQVSIVVDKAGVQTWTYDYSGASF